MKSLQPKIKFLIEEPIKIALLWVATDILKYLSAETQQLVYEKTIESADYIIKHFNNVPQGQLFEYNTPIEGRLEYSYVAFWDRRENKNFVVVASFGFCPVCYKGIPATKMKMLYGFVDEYFNKTL